MRTYRNILIVLALLSIGALAIMAVTGRLHFPGMDNPYRNKQSIKNQKVKIVLQKPKTPKDALAHFIKALEKRNKEKFLISSYFGENKQEYAVAMFDIGCAMVDFADKFHTAYGNQSNWMFCSRYEDYKKLAKNGKFKEDGNKANANISDATLNFMKKGDCWKVDMSDQVPDGKKYQIAIDFSEYMTEAISNVNRNIGEQGYTGEKTHNELLENMKIAMWKFFKQYNKRAKEYLDKKHGLTIHSPFMR